MNKQKEILNFLNLSSEDLKGVKAAQATAQAQEVRIFGEIYEYSLHELNYNLDPNGTENVEFLINSGGGSVFDGVAMASLIKRYKGETTATGLGFVASIASVILLAADKARLNKGALLMIHNAWSFEAGEAEDFRKTADLLEKISGQIAEVYVSKIQKNDKLINGDIKETRAAIIEMMKNETYLTADEALKLGLIDEITDESATLEALTKDQLNEIVNKYGEKAPKSFLNMSKDIFLPKNGAKLGDFLNETIDKKVNEEKTKGDIIEDIATAAGISPSTVNQILNGSITCPPENRLEGFASALNISMSSIISAAESDGCAYNPKDSKMIEKQQDLNEKDLTFWAKLKAYFTENPDKLNEVKAEGDEMPTEEQEQPTEEQINEAKEILEAAGFEVVEKEAAEQASQENEALKNAANSANKNLNALQKDYDFIMSKLKEFEAEFNAPTAKAELNKPKEEKPKTKNTREDILNELNKNDGLKDSKFFKMINNN